MTPKELNAIAAKLAEQLANHRRKKADVIPPGWATAQQLSKAMKRDVSCILLDLKVVGAEKKNFMVALPQGVRAIPHYQLK